MSAFLLRELHFFLLGFLLLSIVFSFHNILNTLKKYTHDYFYKIFVHFLMVKNLILTFITRIVYWWRESYLKSQGFFIEFNRLVLISQQVIWLAITSLSLNNFYPPRQWVIFSLTLNIKTNFSLQKYSSIFWNQDSLPITESHRVWLFNHHIICAPC